MLRSIVGIISCLTTIMSISQQYSFIQYSRPEGLPQTQISSIVQDSKGYLWIGTVGGLSRFNGIEFSNSSKSEGLLDNQVNCLFVDSANNVWVGNNGGISLVNQNKISGYPFKKELDKVAYAAFTFIEKNCIWGLDQMAYSTVLIEVFKTRFMMFSAWGIRV